jgi:hypothetical protein
MSRAEAANEALRLARDLLATMKNDRWALTIADASPCMFDPRPVDKTPTKWILSTRCELLDSPGAVIDGGDPAIVVDLLTETARFAE